MMKILELKIEIRSVEHMKDKSCYNHNFYKITVNHPVVPKENIYEYKFILQDSFDDKEVATKHAFLKKTIVAKSKEEADKAFEEFKEKVDREKTPLPSLGRYRKTWNMQTPDEYKERMTKELKQQIKELQENLKYIEKNIDSAEFNEIDEDRIYKKAHRYEYR